MTNVTPPVEHAVDRAGLPAGSLAQWLLNSGQLRSMSMSRIPPRVYRESGALVPINRVAKSERSVIVLGAYELGREHERVDGAEPDGQHGSGRADSRVNHAWLQHILGN